MPEFNHQLCQPIIDAMKALNTPASLKQIGARMDERMSSSELQFPMRELLNAGVVTKYGNGYYNLPKTKTGRPVRQPLASEQITVEVTNPESDKPTVKLQPTNILDKVDAMIDQMQSPGAAIPELLDADIKIAMLEKFKDITEDEIAAQFWQLIVWIKRVNAIREGKRHE